MLTLLGLVLAIAAVLLVLEPILRPSTGAPAPGSGGDFEDDPREHRKELALAALKEIEFDRATGKLSDADYEKMHARYTREAVEALRDAEAIAGSSGGNGHGAAPVAGVAPRAAADDPVERLIAEARQASKGKRFCTNCGAVLEGSGRFCVECGVRV